jgi:tetratricopeptide (TPR) repeat protein
MDINPRRRTLPALVLILLAGILVYANTFQAPFVLDDIYSIVNNAAIKDPLTFSAKPGWYARNPERLVAFLTFGLNYHFGGLDVTGYHVVNLAIHLANGLLVYMLVWMTFRTPYFQMQTEIQQVQAMEASGTMPSQRNAFYLQSPPQSQSVFASQPSAFIPLFAALLFVVHPVQTQAVTYIVQRMTSLASMFYLLSLILYVQARLAIENTECRMQDTEYKKRNPEAGIQHSEKKTYRTGSKGRIKPALLISGSVIAAVLAMKTKEIAFTLPMAVVLYEACFFRGAWKRRMFYLLPLLATLPIVPMSMFPVGLALDQSPTDMLSNIDQRVRAQSSMPRLDYLFTQFRVIVTYLRLLILPVNQNLDYDYPVYTNFFSPQVFWSFLLLAAILTAAAYLFWRTGGARMLQVENRTGAAAALRLIAFGIFWFFLTLIVESSFIPIKDVIVEHRLYLPVFGAVAAFAATFCLLAGRFARPAEGKPFMLLAALLVLGFGIAAHQRNHVWGDAVRLWQDVVAKSPNKVRPHNNLGDALNNAGRLTEAIEVLSRAIALDPSHPHAYNNLGRAYIMSGRSREALPVLKKAIRIDPAFDDAYINLAAAYNQLEQFHEAVDLLERNINLLGRRTETHYQLGVAYALLGKWEAFRQKLAIVSRGSPILTADLLNLLTPAAGHDFPEEHEQARTLPAAVAVSISGAGQSGGQENFTK